MGFYGEHVLPRLMDKACGTPQGDVHRERACAGLAGEVVEIGFGSGHNLRFYPSTVRSVAVIEPSDLAWRLAAPRIAASPVPVHRAGLDAQSVPLPDDSADAVLSTWTMCTIPDLDAALSELRRVLRPGGRLHLLEHGLAPDESVRRWQRRVEPLHQRLAGGCHLTRRIPEQVEAAGFDTRALDTFYEEGTPKILGADSLGVFVNPG